MAKTPPPLLGPTGSDAPSATSAGALSRPSALRRVVRGTFTTFKVLGNMLALMLVALFIFVAWSSAAGKMQFVPLRTGSMSPLIAAGDLAILRPVPAGSIGPGDVIAFIPPGLDENNRYVHRVVKVDRYDPQPIVFTKGDANPVQDSWSPIRLGERTVWKYERTIPKAGFVVFWVQSPTVRKALIIVGGLALFAPLALWIWKPRKKKVADDEITDSSESGNGDASVTKVTSPTGPGRLIGPTGPRPTSAQAAAEARGDADSHAPPPPSADTISDAEARRRYASGATLNNGRP